MLESTGSGLLPAGIVNMGGKWVQLFIDEWNSEHPKLVRSLLPSENLITISAAVAVYAGRFPRTLLPTGPL